MGHCRSQARMRNTERAKLERNGTMKPFILHMAHVPFVPALAFKAPTAQAQLAIIKAAAIHLNTPPHIAAALTLLATKMIKKM